MRGEYRYCIGFAVRLLESPRLRGEYETDVAKKQTNKGSPPLARGILYKYLQNNRAMGITPACAGNTIFLIAADCKNRDHPRLRGEYSIPFDRRVALIGSPPLTRGIRGIDNTICYISRITPACAGNTYSRIPKWSGCRDHPRLRGEYEQT